MGPISPQPPYGDSNWRKKIYIIIFESNTPAGKQFDVVLILAIVASVTVVMMESVDHLRAEHGATFRAIEWLFTIFFTVEYLLRLISVRHPWRYATSFFGVVDFLAILPTYLSLLIPGAHSLLVVRSFRLLRIFRVFKLAKYLREANVLYVALRAGRPKIIVFLVGVMATVISMGTLMYLLEGPASGFTSIPMGIYWSIVTMTTVGYGDIAPVTPLGRVFAALLMITGYGVLAVPTGILSVEIARASQVAFGQATIGGVCTTCGHVGHEPDANFCRKCGSVL